MKSSLGLLSFVMTAGISSILTIFVIAFSTKWLIIDLQQVNYGGTVDVLLITAQVFFLYLIWTGLKLRKTSAKLSWFCVSVPVLSYLATFMMHAYLVKVL